MKPCIRAFTFAILCLVLISCTKSEDDQKLSNKFTGTWKLTESLIDMGNGNGKWTKVSESQNGYPYITFKNDSTVESNIFVDIRRYRVIDSTKVRFTFFDNRKIEYRYTFKNAMLIINPPCIEGCGYRFIKAD